MRKLLLILAVALPGVAKRFVYNRLLGWAVAPTARIGLSYIDARHVEVGPRSRIGHFNVIRNLNHFACGADTYIANFNQVTGARTLAMFASRLVIGDRVMFMSHHFVDAAGSVAIGDGTTVGGRDTHVWSHTLRLTPAGTQEKVPTSAAIGRDVYVGARVTVVGCLIPDGTVVAAGTVVNKSFPAEPVRFLLAGNPASIRKRYPPPEPVGAPVGAADGPAL